MMVRRSVFAAATKIVRSKSNTLGRDVAILRYLRSERGFESDLPYQGPFGGGDPPPTTFRGDWMSTRWNRPSSAAGPGATAPPSREPAAAEPEQPLRRAMATNPR